MNINKDYWYGKEIEGRFTGLETVFVYKSFPKDVLDYPHLYITSNKLKTMNENDWLYCFDLITNKNKLITIEIEDGSGQIDMIPPRLSNMVHIMLKTKCHDIGKIKNMDTISIEERMYNCFFVTKNSLQKVTGDAYNIDIFKEI